MNGEHPRQEGSLLGGILLVAGCCTGAGMLGLPVLSAAAGFIPSLILFVLCWLFMAATGLLLLEVNLLFQEEVSIISMTGKTLGRIGQTFSWICFLFLFYSLMVAYTAGCGVLVTDFVAALTGKIVPNWIGGLAFNLLFGLFVFFGTKAVDELNRLLMTGLIVSYFALVGFGIAYVKPELLLHTNWLYSIAAIPAMIISFGYHNLIPSLCSYMQRNVRKLRLTILIGSAVPLLIYLIWEALVLGIVPSHGFLDALDKGEMAVQSLRSALGASWIVTIGQYFAFFAIVTSFLAVALSLVDFLADGLHIKKTPAGKIALCAMALLPPFICAFTYPGIFLTALNYAGGFGAVILFGILPALMVWKSRYTLHETSQPIVPGGKPMLLLIIVISAGIVMLQLLQELQLVRL